MRVSLQLNSLQLLSPPKPIWKQSAYVEAIASAVDRAGFLSELEILEPLEGKPKKAPGNVAALVSDSSKWKGDQQLRSRDPEMLLDLVARPQFLRVRLTLDDDQLERR